MNEFKKHTRAQKCAQRLVCNIRELVKDFNLAKDSPESEEYKEAKKAIQQSKFGVVIRSAWIPPHAKMEPYEYMIALTDLGPVRLRGLLDELNDPYTARLEYQEKGEPWKEYQDIMEEDKRVLLEYANII